MRSTATGAKGRFADGRTQHVPTQRPFATSAQGPSTPSVSNNLASTSSGPPHVRARPPAQQASARPMQSNELASRVNTDNQVVAFLKECGLQMYAATLLQHGFDEMETLHAIEDADIRELGIPQYHAALLQESLRELREREDGADQANSHGVVVAFLEEHGLAQYSSVLLSSGFDEMETLLDADDVDLKDLGFPRGHALKLRRHLRKYQTNLYQEETQAVVAVQPAVVKGMARPSPAPAPRRAQPRPVVELEASETMKGDVERSWDIIQELGTAVVGERVYRAFFDMVPEAMENFPAHVRLKYREWTADESDDEADLKNSAALRKLFAKVLNAVGCVVAGLQDSSKLVPLLTSLGGRHIAYNTNEAFWPALGKAVNMVLSDILGDGFTPEVENAWNVVYGFTSSIMIAGLRQAIAAAQQRSFEDGDCGISQRSRASQQSRGTEDMLAMVDDAQQRKASAPAADSEWHRSVSESSATTER